MIKTLTVVLTTLLLALSISAQTEDIVWEKDFKKAKALARETSRPLLLDFTAPWCKPCKAMDERFWVLPDVVQMIKPFVAVKVDFDNEKGLVGKYNVSAIPFVVFADPLGNVVTFRRGFGEKSVRDLNSILNEMPKDFSALNKYYDAIELKKDDGNALLKIADAYRNSRMLRLSSDFYKKALKTEEIQADAEKTERISVTLGLNAYSVQDYREANEIIEDYMKNYPSGKYREVSFAALIVGSAKLGKWKAVDKYLPMFKGEFPSSNSYATILKTVEEEKNKKDK
ncbi:MAG TPA: thioredoxin family protein [Pyrinomonadaceae bacterium]|jgi:thioredoxin-like negative regulator of GroEL